MPRGPFFLLLALLPACAGSGSSSTHAAARRDRTPPPPVSGARTLPGKSQVTLSWTNPASADLFRVRVLRKEGAPPAGPRDPAAALVFEALGTSLIDTGLSASVEYHYAIFSLDRRGNASAPALVQASPAGGGGPARVTRIAASAERHRITLSWDLPGDPSVTGIRVLRKEGRMPFGPTDPEAETLVDGLVAEAVDENPRDGISTFYAAFAHDAAGNFAPPLVRSATPRILGSNLPAPPDPLPDVTHPLLAGVDDWGYMLDGVDLEGLGATAYDLLVVDPTRDGSETTRFSPAEIAALKNSPGGPKIVLAYLSIGEAEDYRFYWGLDHGQPGADWKRRPPAWLGPENRGYPGNFKVHYWDPEWQAIIIHNPGGHPVLGELESALDRILAAGFDGVWLDIIDAFEFFGPRGDGGNGTRPQAAGDMALFVEALSRYARGVRPGFIVSPQNGATILSEDLVHPLSAAEQQAYLDAVDALGVEDILFAGKRDENNRYRPDLFRVPLIDRFRAAGKRVLTIDYLTPRAAHFRQPDLDSFFQLAGERGWVPTSSRRNLDEVTLNPGHFPD